MNTLMPADTPSSAPAPTFRASGASGAIDVLGDAWVLRLLRSAFRGARRFSDFLAELDVSRAVLSERLERMVSDQLLEKVAPGGGRSEYRLTERGLDLWGTLIAMWSWERAWGTGQHEPPHPRDRPRSRLVHLACGHETMPMCTCAHCKAVVSPFDTSATPGPGAPAGPGNPTNQAPPGVGGAGDADGAEGADGADGDEGVAEGSAIASASVPSRKRFRKSHSADRSALPTLMRVYGDRWNSSVIAAALQGARTFSEFERALGIGPTQLSDRLLELQTLGMLRPRAYAGSRQEYHLTRAAVATFPITLELIRWGDRWLWGGRGPLAVLHHPCGQVLGLQWRCSHCGGGLERTGLAFGDQGTSPDIPRQEPERR
jgi:DNA-binding HxlR family transcriptional regulator